MHGREMNGLPEIPHDYVPPSTDPAPDPPSSPPDGTAPQAASRPHSRPASDPELFGEFRFGCNGEVRTGYTTLGRPNVIVAPNNARAEYMAFAEKGYRAVETTVMPNGLNYAYYEGYWEWLPDFNSLLPKAIGTCNNFDISVRLRDDRFALHYNGYIDIETSGEYTFYTSSDDGSCLWIGETLVVNNDGLHSPRERSGTITLSKGRYSITVAFFERKGGEHLEVQYRGQGISKTRIPDHKLYIGSGIDALYLWQAGRYTPALNRTPGRFSLAYPHHGASIEDQYPLFYEDTERTFFAMPGRDFDTMAKLMEGDQSDVFQVLSVHARKSVDNPQGLRWRFQSFYHPFMSTFLKELICHGIEGLYNPQLQKAPESFLHNKRLLDFTLDYRPEPAVVDDKRHPVEEIDFGSNSTVDCAYSLYNWEIFFHVPMLIADRLSNNQRFEEAQRWYHFIFDPTNRDANDTVPDRYWRFKPFKGVNQYSIQMLLGILSSDSDNEEKERLLEQVRQWRNDPFDPHLVAQLRWTAYQKTVVMKYIDNLIKWGDQLFRRDTIESINEATQLYILAAELLGPRPTKVPFRGQSRARTFNELNARQDDFLVRLENVAGDISEVPANGDSTPVLLTAPHYFCTPKNDKLLKHWDTVEDRLFKIRHCQNIEGVTRQLALFAPPIEPGLLVRAAAAGIDLSSMFNDTNTALPHYRFRIMLQKAVELCADLKSLGASLLSALEKRDAEALALLRSDHEIRLLEAVKTVRERQIDEAKESLEGIKNAKKVTEERSDYYRDIVRINENEQLYLDNLASAHKWQEIGQMADIAAQVLPLIGDFDVGVGGWACSPIVKWRWGGLNLAQAAQATSRVMGLLSTIAMNEANRASIKAGYDRRWDDWKLQERLAAKELEQINKQILAAEIRVDLAEKELSSHERQMENTKEAETFLKDKFTNRELYDWMVSQISAVYFQSYQLAYDIAKRAQRAYQFERSSDESFIEFGYWDSLKKGLLAGDKLHYDLKRMEMAYLEQNRREYELSKHISLALLDPVALLRLKETGECFIDLPEEVFDLDHPGHYLRRIKTLNITIPCVTGPYTGVNCTLTLLWNTVRRNSFLPDGGGSYARERINGTFRDDDRFLDSIGAIQSIVTSSGRDDSGLFEQNLQDERYLPFEGAGTISRWRIQLPKETNPIDFDSISDVVLSLRYTAREGGNALRQAAMDHLHQWVAGAGHLYKLFSVRHQFPDAWHRFLMPPGTDTPNRLQLRNLRKHVPAILGASDLRIHALVVLMGIDTSVDYANEAPLRFVLTKNDDLIGTEHSLTIGLDPVPVLPAAHVITSDQNNAIDFDDSIWQFRVNQAVLDEIAEGSSLVISETVNGVQHNRLNGERLEDIWFLIEYSVKN